MNSLNTYNTRLCLRSYFYHKYVLKEKGSVLCSFGVAVKNVYMMRKVRQRVEAAVDRAARAVRRKATMRMMENRSVL